MSSGRCKSGKRGFYDYGDAIRYLTRVLDGSGGSYARLYRCPSCHLYHLTRTAKITDKPAGRGKRRRKGRPVVTKA
jgi:hypothetical protein